MKTPAKRKSTTKRKSTKKEVQPIPVVEKPEFIPYKPKPLKFKKAGVNYNEGDTVCVTDTEGNKHTGILRNILSSMLVVDDTFYFQRGIKIEKVKK
jgi:hypothetical protein